MKCCQHLNIEISEEFVAYSYFSFRNGSLEYHDHTPEGGDYTGSLHVKCADCGYGGKFNRFQKNNPAWLVGLLDQIAEESRQ